MLADFGSGLRVGIVIRIDVDQLHVKVRIRSRGGDLELRRNGTGDGHIFAKRIGFVDENIWPRRSEALVVDHIALWHCVSYISHKGYGMSRIAGVRVRAFVCGRRIERELASGVEVERTRHGLRGWPRIILAPDICAGLEDISLGHRLSLVLQVVLEEGKLDVLAEILGGLGVECYVTEMIAIAARPASVHPWAFDNCIHRSRILLLNRLVGAHRSHKVFGIEPSANSEHSAVNIIHVLRQVADLPVIVVGVVVHLVVVERISALEINLVEIPNRPGLQIELICAGRSHVEGNRRQRRCRRVLRHKEGVEAEVGVEHEGSAVVAVVAHEKIRHRSLRRSGLERGMRVNDAGRGIEARIRDAPDADASVVVGHMLQQIIDGVGGVGAIVHILWRFLHVDVGTHFYKGPLRHVAPANILIDEDISGFFKFIRGTEALGILVYTVGSNAVGCAIHEEGIALRCILGHINSGKEMDVIPHGDTVFILCVMSFHVIVVGRGRFILRGGREDKPGDKRHGERAVQLAERFHARSCLVNQQF